MGVQTPYQRDQPFPTADPGVLDPYAGAFGGIVVNESWSQLEPSPGVEDWAPLDRSLEAVRRWNAAHRSAPLGVKLRIFAGSSAPAWVVARSGPTVTLRRRGGTKVAGRWWTAPFRHAWRSFQHALAARFDPDPLVRAVSVSSCSSSTGEPFVVSGAPSSRQALAAAGWTPALQERCLDGALADYSGWTRTPVTFAFNPLRTASGTDMAFTERLMRACAGSRAAGGPTCVVGNNDLSAAAPTRPGAAPVYAAIDALEAPGAAHPAVYFQTVGPPVACQAVAVAVGHHASSVELWPPVGRLPGFTAVPVATLSRWDRALRSAGRLAC